jgi:voltage-gated potassium channel
MQRTEDMPPPGMGHMATEVRMVVRGASRTHEFLRARLTFLAGATLALDVLATLAMYMFEHDHPDSGFDDVGGALFWVSAQLTTVSSQMPNPVTTPGRILDIVLEIWAITVAATLAASLAAFFHARHIEHMARETAPGSPAPLHDERGS